ncbi:MAG: M56 family metallopeptidase [Candidatus Latescibacterota bacterium]
MIAHLVALLSGTLGTLGPLADGLLRASVAGTGFAAIVWTCCRLVPRLSAAARCALWWCVGLKLLLDLVWLGPIEVPVLPTPGATVAAASMVASPAVLAPVDAVGSGAGPEVDRLASARRVSPTAAAMAGLVFIALAAWGAGVLVGFGSAVRRYRRTLAVIRRSETMPAAEVVVADLSRLLGLTHPPRVRVSDDVDTPLVAGVVRPVVLLPAGFAALSGAQQRMALCHELAHIKRADLWSGWVPALAECLFFFHPLAHVAAREYGLWREAACDAIVLRSLAAAPHDYGRLLLSLPVSRPDAGLVATGAPWSFPILKRRIAMLRDPSSTPRSSRAIAAAAVGLAVLALTLTVAPFDRVSAQADPEAGSMPIAQDSVRPPQEAEISYVLFTEEGKQNTMTWGKAAGDVNRARQLRRSGERLLWFRRGGKEYVVRDTALLQQVIEVWRPVHELADQQGRLASQQGELGAKQGQLAAKQGELAAKHGELAAKQGELAGKQGVLAAKQGELAARKAALEARESAGQLTDAEQTKIEQEERATQEQISALGDQMAELGARMAEYGRPMRELGDQMAEYAKPMRELGDQMAVFGRKMEEASARAEADMGALIARTVASGLAQEVR